MRLSRSARQALEAALEMARAGDAWVPVAEVARTRRIPESSLAKVFQRLVRAGIAVGARGIGGGYRLARDASEVTVADVLAVFDPPPDAPDPPNEDPAASRLLALLAEVDESTRATFASVSLAVLAERGEVPAGLIEEPPSA